MASPFHAGARPHTPNLQKAMLGPNQTHESLGFRLLHFPPWPSGRSWPQNQGPSRQRRGISWGGGAQRVQGGCKGDRVSPREQEPRRGDAWGEGAPWSGAGGTRGAPPAVGKLPWERMHCAAGRRPGCGGLRGLPQDTAQLRGPRSKTGRCHKNSKKVLKEESHHFSSNCLLEPERC